VSYFVLLYSFGMAYDFIDNIGDDVDVVSDSEVCHRFQLSNHQAFIPGKPDSFTQITLIFIYTSC
jgi:hypothetical protein